NNGEAVLRTANRLYAHAGLGLKESFRSTATGSFRAGAEELDFVNATDASRRAINTWVEQNTAGKIKDLFEEGATWPYIANPHLPPRAITELARLLLVNAMYFKAGWENPFLKSETNHSAFHVSPTFRVYVPTMHGTFELVYGELPEVNAIAVRLPFAPEEAGMSMVTLLPNNVDGLQRLEGALAALGESTPTPTPAPPTPPASEVARQAVTAAANAFSLRLYQAVKANASNVVISPLSAAVLLALTRHGAAGATEQQIASALQLSTDRETTASGYGALLDSLQNNGEAVLRTANRLYAHAGLGLKESFRSTATGSFRAGAEELDFVNATDASRRAINTWVEQNTAGKIKDLFEEGAITQLTRLVLVNAIYFKAGWWKPFDVSETNSSVFHVTPTSQVNVPTMHGTFQLDFGELPAVDAKAVRLPYKAGDAQMSMVILLPNTVDGLERLEAGLDQLDLNNLTPGFGEVILSLPKIRIESKYNLKEKLKELGITELFNPSADLSGISEHNLYVDEVVQKTFIGVDERGTEAAVATGINWFIGMIYPRVDFRADHPFLFMIKKENTILFLGRVVNPRS
ncbi:Serine protease inhibitor 42Dd, partial [Gryllus bimaculatus]